MMDLEIFHCFLHWYSKQLNNKFTNLNVWNYYDDQIDQSNVQKYISIEKDDWSFF